MRNVVNQIKFITGAAFVAFLFVLTTGTAMGVTDNNQQQPSLVDVSGSLARASTDIRVRRLKQMFNNNQISSEEFFVRATQPEGASAPISAPRSIE